MKRIFGALVLPLVLAGCIQTRTAVREQEEKQVLQKTVKTLQQSTADVNTRFVDVSARLIDWRDDMNRRFDEVNRRFAALDQKGDRHFHWMVSTQVALLLAVVGALVGAYYR